MDSKSGNAASTSSTASKGLLSDILLDPIVCIVSCQNWHIFRKSSTPVKMMVFDKISSGWTDLPYETVEVVKEAFSSKDPTVEIELHGAPHLLDFLSMLLIEVGPRWTRSVAWEDAEESCFFPKQPLSGWTSSSSIALAVDDYPEPLFEPSLSILKRLSRTDKQYKKVEKTFLKGMFREDPGAIVAAVYSCSHVSQEAVSRLVSFERTMATTRAKLGSPNIRRGWYGTSAKRVEAIISNGFENGDTHQGSAAFGSGIYLSSMNFSYIGASYSKLDSRGEYHVLLCKVILGNVEKIRKGSNQFQPSNENFDCGVDDVRNPRLYIVRTSKLKTHIIPECVVSFKVSRHVQEYWRRLQVVRAGHNDLSGTIRRPVLMSSLPQAVVWIQEILLLQLIHNKKVNL